MVGVRFVVMNAKQEKVNDENKKHTISYAVNY